MRTFKEILTEAKGDKEKEALKAAYLKSSKKAKENGFGGFVSAITQELEDEGVKLKNANAVYKYLYGTAFKYGVDNPADLARAFAEYLKASN